MAGEHISDKSLSRAAPKRSQRKAPKEMKKQAAVKETKNVTSKTSALTPLRARAHKVRAR